MVKEQVVMATISSRSCRQMRSSRGSLKAWKWVRIESDVRENRRGPRTGNHAWRYGGEEPRWRSSDLPLIAHIYAISPPAGLIGIS